MSFDRDTQIVGSSHYPGAQDWLQRRHDRREKLQLRRERTNSYDANAIAVLTSTGLKLGHLPREIAARFGPLLDDGYDVRAFKTRETWGSVRLVTPGTWHTPRRHFKSGEGDASIRPERDAGPSVSDELAIL